MSKTYKLHAFRCGAALAAMMAGLMSTGAYAEETAPAASPEPAADSPTEVVVTGTRIKRPNLKSSSPITSMDSKEVQLQGALQIENALNRLPQFLADANENVSNGSNGTAQVNLRGLGSSRNLVLIDGQRFLPTEAVDLNFIPSYMVERTDILTGGASSVYGSDAISGVVNFVMKKDLDGFRVDAQVGGAQTNNDNTALRTLVGDRGFDVAPANVWDGAKENFNLAYGKNFGDGRGNITAYAGYFHADAVTEASRDYSACALGLDDTAASGFFCGGSSNSAYGRFILLSGDNSGSSYANNPDGSKSFVPWSSAYQFNYAPTNYIQRSDNRVTAGAFAHYDFSDKFQLYGSVMLMQDHTYSQIAPSAIWLGTTFDINCDNPLMSDAQKTTICGSTTSTDTAQSLIGYRMANSGLPRRDDLIHKDARLNIGFKGDLTDNISYDVSYIQSAMFYNETFLNDINQEKAAKALLVKTVGGVATCESVIDGTDPDCVPVDIFSTAGPSAESLAYLSDPSETRDTQRLNVLSANINADLTKYGIKSPWADDGLAVAFGADRRIETLNFVASELALQNGSQNSDGYTESKEAYTELNFPIIQDKPFVKSWLIDGAYRYTKYAAHSSLYESPEKTLETYKIETQYAPDNNVMFRASFNVASRAPNISELFTQQGQSLFSGQDPCGSAMTATQAQCELSGVTASQYGSAVLDCPADQCNYQYGGNPNLDPEKAKTLTVGVVYTPTYISGLSVSLDYFKIKVDDYIGIVDPSFSLDQCLTTGSSFYCGMVHRSSIGLIYGTDGYIVATNVNTGYLKTSGVDLTADYLWHSPIGKLAFSFGGSYLIDQITQPLPGVDTYDCKGHYGDVCGDPRPEWRHNLRTTWSVPNSPATVSLNWRYTGSVTLSEPLGSVNDKIDAYNYFDLAATYTLKDRYKLRAGINNMFDKTAPAIASDVLTGFQNGNTYPGIYDPLGRTLFIGLTADF